VGLAFRLEVLREGGVGDATHAWTVAEMDLAGRFQVPNDLYPVWALGVGGVEDSDGHITGTAGLALSQAGAVIQSLMESWLGLTIESGSFTTAKALTNWDGSSTRFAFGVGAGWLSPQMPGSDLLAALTTQMYSVLFPSGAGTSKLVRLALTPSSAYPFTASTMAHVVVETSRMEEVHHEFIVRYNWSPVTQQYQNTVYANQGGCNHANGTIAGQLTTLCADSYARYGRLPPLQIDAWGITHRPTAEMLLEALTRRFWSQNILVTWDAPMVGIHLEVSDGVTLTYAELPAAVNGTIFTILRVTHRPETGSDPGPLPLQLQAQSGAL
jgi:hypothetical protein